MILLFWFNVIKLVVLVAIIMALFTLVKLIFVELRMAYLKDQYYIKKYDRDY